MLIRFKAQTREIAQIGAQKPKGGLLAQPALDGWLGIRIGLMAQSVQRRSPRNLIWSSEAWVKVGNDLLTTL